MARGSLPAFMEARTFSSEEAMKLTVRSGMTVCSGFATSEPHAFYDGLWDHIQREDLVDLEIRQALFMAPHKVCVGHALESKGLFNGFAETATSASLFGNLARTANAVTKKLEGLKRLVEHYRELRARRIRFTSPFIGAATNILVPSSPLLRMLYPEFAGRNTSRLGITDMQSVHFPDAVDAMGFPPEGGTTFDTFVGPVTPPNADGEMSHGLASAAKADMVTRLIRDRSANLVLYVNPRLPFTRGYDAEASNTFPVEALTGLANEGKLFVVHDDSELPGLPPGSFANPSATERTIAENVVNHIEMNAAYTHGRAIQVGFGGTGVLAIRALKESSWRGRSYTEMLEPFTLDLFDAGKIEGSHFIEQDGRRTPLDGKMVATFAIAEKGSDFYRRIDDNPAIILAPASRVVIPEAFKGGLGINNCLAVDFHGHVNAGGRFRNHHSGIGGLAMINRGLACGGVSYLCLKSTHRGLDGRPRSSIMPYLTRGSTVSLIGPDVMGGREGARFFLATEHGIARLSGCTQSQLIRQLVGVAHPDFREDLAAAAWREFRVRV